MKGLHLERAVKNAGALLTRARRVIAFRDGTFNDEIVSQIFNDEPSNIIATSGRVKRALTYLTAHSKYGSKGRAYDSCNFTPFTVAVRVFPIELFENRSSV